MIICGTGLSLDFSSQNQSLVRILGKNASHFYVTKVLKVEGATSMSKKSDVYNFEAVNYQFLFEYAERELSPMFYSIVFYFAYRKKKNVSALFYFPIDFENYNVNLRA